MKPLPDSSPRFEELKRTSRILELVQMIAVAPRRYLRRDLANRFEISERMIQKDLDIVRNGLKLRLVHSADGYYFEEVPRLPALQFSFSEALALLLALQAAVQVSGVAAGELAAALARLETLLPAEFLPLLRQALSPPAFTSHNQHRQEMLALLNQALLHKRKVRMTYETRSRAGDISERVVHPYRIMPYVRSWQLVAYCELRQAILLFKVDRIHRAGILQENYSVPDSFNLQEYLGQGWGLMRGYPGETEDVRLLFSAQAGGWVSEELWHPGQQAETLADGSVRFSLPIAPTPEFLRWLLYYGDQVYVEQPDWLRDKVREAHRRAVEIHNKE